VTAPDPLGGPTGGLLDPATGDWEPLPASPAPPRDELRIQASSAERVTAGEGLVLDVSAGRWHALEPHDGAATEGVSVAWAGGRLVVFGGNVTEEPSRRLTAAAHVWTAPAR
jgi:hypothetical protein